MDELRKELQELYDADQEDRVGKLKIKDFVQNDTRRLERARQIYRDFKEQKILLSPESLYCLAMLFQHSPDIKKDGSDYKIAFELASISGEMGHQPGKWLSAAAEDRYLLAIGKKQKWGTQFHRDEKGEWEQSPMSADEESGITDGMRKEKGVPPRDGQIKVFLGRSDT